MCIEGSDFNYRASERLWLTDMTILFIVAVSIKYLVLTNGAGNGKNSPPEFHW